MRKDFEVHEIRLRVALCGNHSSVHFFVKVAQVSRDAEDTCEAWGRCSCSSAIFFLVPRKLRCRIWHEMSDDMPGEDSQCLSFNKQARVAVQRHPVALHSHPCL